MAITFITSHPKKAEQLSRHINYDINHVSLDLPEIQSLDPVEITTRKALEAYKHIGKPVLVEDLSVYFEALGKLPGPLIKWFLEGLKAEGICRLLDGYETRKATVAPFFGLCIDGENVHIFSAEMRGSIRKTPVGDTGFGLDSTFIPEGCDKTWGEMDMEEQTKTSVRRLALNKLQEFLKQNPI